MPRWSFVDAWAYLPDMLVDMSSIELGINP